MQIGVAGRWGSVTVQHNRLQAGEQQAMRPRQQQHKSAATGAERGTDAACAPEMVGWPQHANGPATAGRRLVRVEASTCAVERPIADEQQDANVDASPRAGRRC